MKDLKKDYSVIIRKADKSNAVLPLEKDDYDSKIETILKNISTYNKFKSDPNESYVAKSRKDLESLKNNRSITFTALPKINPFFRSIFLLLKRRFSDIEMYDLLNFKGTCPHQY